jgi:beta-barrel assembly-enhancing protease
MNIKNNEAGCTCGADGVVHTAACGCYLTREYLAEPVARYTYSRRELLSKALTAGAMTALPLFLTEEAEADIFRPSVGDQKKLGEQAAQDVLKKYKVVTDSRAKSFDRVGRKLVANMPSQDRSKWDYRFRVVQSNDVNAFALPGGNMFIFTGLLDKIGSTDELAAVTGHEIAHVRREHWAKQYASQQKRAVGLGVLLGLTKANKSIQSIAGIGNSLLSLRYSRDDEFDADKNGLTNMVAANYDARGMIDLFETLQKSSGGKGGGPEFLSTHPMSKERIERVEEFIAKQ